MNVIRLPTRPDQRPVQPIVAFVDLQLEYVSGGRAFGIEETEGCLVACASLLRAARQHRLSIVHFRQLRREACFNPRTPFSDWIDEFRPRPSEAVYERSLPSIYANADFANFIDAIEQPTILLAGLSGDQSCLSSAVDAYHRGHRLIFLNDCSATASVGGRPESDSHAFVTSLVESYAEVASSQAVIAFLERAEDEPMRRAR